jgi:hypothetical protein
MPEWKQEIKQRLKPLQLAATREAAIVEELAQHLGDYYAELLAGGASELIRSSLCAVNEPRLNQGSDARKEIKRD